MKTANRWETQGRILRSVETRAAVAEGTFFTRDLVNEPANVLTTVTFAERLVEMQSLGLKVEVLEEEQLAELGMRTLLAVGQGSASPSKVVVMQWNGGKDGAAPLALVGKGVVFDTGGISLKPASGMEDMTMDMGGGGTVAGVMRTLARRKAKANVVGIVGIVENLFGTYVSIEFKSVVAFALIVIILCIKPSGLLARHYVKKV